MTRLAFSASLALLSVPAFAAVDFEKDVKPILEFNCVRCHNPKGTEFEKGDTDLNLTTHETATVTKELERITKEESEIIKNWINEGAKWPDGMTLTARKKEAASKGAGAEAAL